jgi:hypothetical protein
LPVSTFLNIRVTVHEFTARSESAYGVEESPCTDPAVAATTTFNRDGFRQTLWLSLAKEWEFWFRGSQVTGAWYQELGKAGRLSAARVRKQQDRGG